jgi:hypothetical protein
LASIEQHIKQNSSAGFRFHPDFFLFTFSSFSFWAESINKYVWLLLSSYYRKRYPPPPLFCVLVIPHEIYQELMGVAPSLTFGGAQPTLPARMLCE